MKVRLTLSLVIVLLLAACGGSSSRGSCGDGKCDAVEQANPSLCPQDCTIPLGASTPAGSQSGSEYAFHINLAIKWTVSCTGVCDAAYIPQLGLYFRGNLTVQADHSVNGTGTMRFIYIDPCQTLMPANSTCEVGEASDGSFTISGQSLGTAPGAKGETLQLTLHLQELPKLPLMHTVQMPQGSLDIPMDTTIASFLRGLLSDAGIFDTAFEILAVQASGDLSAQEIESASRFFEGEYQLSTNDGAMAHSLTADGGLLFIRPDMPMP